MIILRNCFDSLQGSDDTGFEEKRREEVFAVLLYL